MAQYIELTDEVERNLKSSRHIRSIAYRDQPEARIMKIKKPRGIVNDCGSSRCPDCPLISMVWIE